MNCIRPIILVIFLLIQPSILISQTYNIEDYFILEPDSCWHYRNVIGTSQENDFTVTVLPETKAVHGTQATQFETKTEIPDEDNCDREFWSIDANGNLFFHGILNAITDGEGDDAFLAGEYILDTPFLAGTRNMTPGQSFNQEISISSGLPSGIDSALISLKVDHLGFIQNYETYLGNYSDVLHIVICVTVVSIDTIFGTTPLDETLRETEVFLANGIGVIAEDQEIGVPDMDVQAIDRGKINGIPIPCTNAPLIVDYLLGRTNDPGLLDINRNNTIDITDLVTCVNDNQ